MAQSLTTSSGVNLKVGMAFDTQKARQSLTAALSQLEQKSKVQVEVNIDNERFVKTVRTYQDAMKNLVEETTLYNGAGKTMSTTITRLTSAEERANRAIAQQTRNTNLLRVSQDRLNSSTQKSVIVFQTFARTFAKMALFNTINIIYDKMVNSMKEAIEITNNFNKAMVEFKKVTDTSGLSLDTYTEKLGKLGEATGRTTKFVWSNVQ